MGVARSIVCTEDQRWRWKAKDGSIGRRLICMGQADGLTWEGIMLNRIGVHVVPTNRSARKYKSGKDSNAHGLTDGILDSSALDLPETVNGGWCSLHGGGFTSRKPSCFHETDECAYSLTVTRIRSSERLRKSHGKVGLKAAMTDTQPTDPTKARNCMWSYDGYMLREEKILRYILWLLWISSSLSSLDYIWSLGGVMSWVTQSPDGREKWSTSYAGDAIPAFPRPKRRSRRPPP
jgi:hypothetical protein